LSKAPLYTEYRNPYPQNSNQFTSKQAEFDDGLDVREWHAHSATMMLVKGRLAIGLIEITSNPTNSLV